MVEKKANDQIQQFTTYSAKIPIDSRSADPFEQSVLSSLSKIKFEYKMPEKMLGAEEKNIYLNIKLDVSMEKSKFRFK